jgi:hypothetical protein
MSDKVECYHCKSQVDGWDRDMDPWVEHVKKKPSCFHIKLVKGAEFIRAVQSKEHDQRIRNILFKELAFSNTEETLIKDDDDKPDQAGEPADNTEGTPPTPFFFTMLNLY